MAKVPFVPYTFELSVGDDFYGISVEPPVDKVEMVGRLVDVKAAAPRLEPVPAAEVVGAMLDVEVPGEIHRHTRPISPNKSTSFTVGAWARIGS